MGLSWKNLQSLINGRDRAQNDTLASTGSKAFIYMRIALRQATLAAMFSPSPDNVCSIAYAAVAQSTEEPE